MVHKSPKKVYRRLLENKNVLTLDIRDCKIENNTSNLYTTFLVDLNLKA